MIRRVAKSILFLLALVPAALLLWGLLHPESGRLGANPAETIQLQTGRQALKFLLFTLAITPARRLTGWNPAPPCSATRVLLRTFSYIVLDQYFSLDAMMGDIVKRPFITVGFAAFVLMVQLAVTSTKGWIRRLGRRWQLLHRLIYISAICAVIHFGWKVKVFTGDPVLYAGILTVLLGFRVVWVVRQRLRKPAPKPRAITPGVS